MLERIGNTTGSGVTREEIRNMLQYFEIDILSSLAIRDKTEDFGGKFHTRWFGPYDIDTVYDSEAIKLRTNDEDKIPLPANGHRLHLYQQPLSKESFLDKWMAQQ